MKSFNEYSKIGALWTNDDARGILIKYFPDIEKKMSQFFDIKLDTVPQYISKRMNEEELPDAFLEQILKDLLAVKINEEEPSIQPSEQYESEDIVMGSAKVRYEIKVEKWDFIEISFEGPSHGNPFVDVHIEAVFSSDDQKIRVPGFYDGNGIYRIRFMPETEGNWGFMSQSNARSLHSIQGNFEVVGPSPNNHGPVRVSNQYHFAYQDGTVYLPFGTTLYAWTHQDEDLEEQTIRTLSQHCFNKVRMCVFPKSFQFNSNEPRFYPFEGSITSGWDFHTFYPEFFHHLEKRISQLCELGIEADIILFHPYDRWGYAEMPSSSDDRYLKYMVSRLAAYRNVWWSLANEYDVMWAKGEEDWERFGAIVKDNDPYGHLLSNHNMMTFYDYSKSWVTHCSIQRIDVYKTSESTLEWRKKWNKPVLIDECGYEGDIDQGWGNITGEEMVRRFWEGAVRGGYVGHGETYYNENEILWWSKGGALSGESPSRIAFLKKIIEHTPTGRLEPLESDWDVPRAGIEGEYYLYYFGSSQLKFRYFNMTPGYHFKAEIIDTWNMTIESVPGALEGKFCVHLPGRPYIALRLTRIHS